MVFLMSLLVLAKRSRNSLVWLLPFPVFISDNCNRELVSDPIMIE
jgi:hypothetical protein